MKILAISDYDPETIEIPDKAIDLIITCGDINFQAYQSLVRKTDLEKVPVFGVAGNHDYYELDCNDLLRVRNIHLTKTEFNGYTFGGFEGSVKYKKGKHQYTDEEVLELMQDFPRVDIFIAHHPPKGIHDNPNERIYTGFAAFSKYIDEKKPDYFIHGHVHKDLKTVVGKTSIISLPPVYNPADKLKIIEIPDK
ncbi:MAG: metallophosphoesterase [Candidatus Aenigmarchaeota archaeon]|nr:metallophosphoesterase [Candidatus Aenigmarchaeota archaeon]